jgi:hypothetical protein
MRKSNGTALRPIAGCRAQRSAVLDAQDTNERRPYPAGVRNVGLVSSPASPQQADGDVRPTSGIV